MQIARTLSAEYGVTTTSFSGMRSVLAASDPDMQHHWSLEQTAGLSSVTPRLIGHVESPELCGSVAWMGRDVPRWLSGLSCSNRKDRRKNSMDFELGPPYGFSVPLLENRFRRSFLCPNG